MFVYVQGDDGVFAINASEVEYIATNKKKTVVRFKSGEVVEPSPLWSVETVMKILEEVAKMGAK